MLTIQNENKQGIIKIHVAVFLFGMAGLFGKLLILPALIIVLGRVFFASIVLGGVISFQKKLSFRLPDQGTFFQLILFGILLAFHWFSFFYAIQLTTVALGLITFATFPVFTALLEPVFIKEKFEWIYLVLALVAGLGVFLATGNNLGEKNMIQGVLWGVLSGLSFALLSIGNKLVLRKTTAIKITFYQDLFACIVLIPFIFLLDFELSLYKWFMLFILGSFLTAGAHFLFINSLKTIKTRTASIISSLEPVYGIILAIIILGEHPGINTILGCLLIIAVSIFISIKK